MVTLAPSIDPAVPTRALCTYERKKSRHNYQPIKIKLRPNQIPPLNRLLLFLDSSATRPIQVVVVGTNQKEMERRWAVRFSDNFLQPIIKCLNSSGVGCVGFLRRGTLLKYPQTLSLIGQKFVPVCVGGCFFSVLSDDSVFSKFDDCYQLCLVCGVRLI